MLPDLIEAIQIHPGHLRSPAANPATDKPHLHLEPGCLNKLIDRGLEYRGQTADVLVPDNEAASAGDLGLLPLKQFLDRVRSTRCHRLGDDACRTAGEGSLRC